MHAGYLVLPFAALGFSLILLFLLVQQKRVRYSERLRFPFFLIFTFHAMVILTQIGAMMAPPEAQLLWARESYTAGVLMALVFCGVTTWLYRPGYKDSFTQEIAYTLRYPPYIMTLLWGLSIIGLAWSWGLRVEGALLKTEPWFMAWVGGGIAWALGYVGVLSYKSLRKQSPVGGRYLKVLALAFSLTLIFYAVLIPTTPIHEPYNLGYLATVLPLVVMIRVMRTPTVLGTLVPAVEGILPGKPEFEFGAGRCYMIKGEAYDVFRDQVEHGVLGVCMSKLRPEKIRERHGLKYTPIVWFTFGEAEDALSPHDLEGAERVISEVFKEAERGIILVDCLDVLKTANGFEHTMGFLRRMKEKVVPSGWIVLFSVNPRRFTAEQLEGLDRELREVGA